MGTEEGVVDNKRHTWTSERIYHFTCGSCKNWWSYALQTEYFGWRTPNCPYWNWKNWTQFTCPHCGHKDITETKLK